MTYSKDLLTDEFKTILELLKQGKETPNEYLVLKHLKQNKHKYVSEKQQRAIRSGK